MIKNVLVKVLFVVPISLFSFYHMLVDAVCTLLDGLVTQHTSKPKRGNKITNYYILTIV